MFTKYVRTIAEIMASVMTEIMMRKVNQTIEADKAEAVSVDAVVKLLEEAINQVPNMPFMLKPFLISALPSISKMLLDLVEHELAKIVKT